MSRPPRRRADGAAQQPFHPPPRSPRGAISSEGAGRVARPGPLRGGGGHPPRGDLQPAGPASADDRRQVAAPLAILTAVHPGREPGARSWTAPAGQGALPRLPGGGVAGPGRGACVPPSRPARRLLLLASRWHELCENARARPPEVNFASVEYNNPSCSLRSPPPFCQPLRLLTQGLKWQGGEVWQPAPKAAVAAATAARLRWSKVCQTADSVCGLRLRASALLVAFLSPLPFTAREFKPCPSRGVRKFKTLPFVAEQSSLNWEVYLPHC